MKRLIIADAQADEFRVVAHAGRASAGLGIIVVVDDDDRPCVGLPDRLWRDERKRERLWKTAEALRVRDVEQIDEERLGDEAAGRADVDAEDLLEARRRPVRV